ncbi:MAG: AMP-binding protein, partial [Candidatus Accumulibacter sp.]|nr:AMP-binding protein [Accumulibacter sp.]
MDQNALWRPSAERIAAARLSAFMTAVNSRWQAGCTDYASLWRWSIADPEAFWTSVWEQCGAIGERGDAVLVDGDRMPGARWFPQARLNYAQNLLGRGEPDADALVFWGEDQLKRRLSNRELQAQVSRFAQALQDAGVGIGDRVAAYLPNMPEALIAMLAAASLGAIWSSASPDFGVQGVLDRFGQIEAKLLLCVDGYWYNGKRVDCMRKNAEIAAQMPSIERCIVVSYLDDCPAVAAINSGQRYADFIAPFAAAEIDFVPLPFDHPLFIMFSSGTTGVPKCIVHCHGGALLQHLKEHQLHSDVNPGDRLFYFTTCGW